MSSGASNGGGAPSPVAGEREGFLGAGGASSSSAADAAMHTAGAAASARPDRRGRSGGAGALGSGSRSNRVPRGGSGDAAAAVTSSLEVEAPAGDVGDDRAGLFPVAPPATQRVVVRRRSVRTRERLARDGGGACWALRRCCACACFAPGAALACRGDPVSGRGACSGCCCLSGASSGPRGGGAGGTKGGIGFGRGGGDDEETRCTLCFGRCCPREPRQRAWVWLICGICAGVFWTSIVCVAFEVWTPVLELFPFMLALWPWVLGLYRHGYAATGGEGDGLEAGVASWGSWSDVWTSAWLVSAIAMPLVLAHVGSLPDAWTALCTIAAGAMYAAGLIGFWRSGTGWAPLGLGNGEDEA